MKKIYISGPISGLPLETVYNNFTNAEVQLLEQDYEPVNPLNNGLPTTATSEEHMRADLRLLLDCDAIYARRMKKVKRGKNRVCFGGGFKVEYPVSAQIQPCS